MKQPEFRSIKVRTSTYHDLKLISSVSGVFIVDIIDKAVLPLKISAENISGKIKDIENKIKSLEDDKQSTIDRLLL